MDGSDRSELQDFDESTLLHTQGLSLVYLPPDPTTVDPRALSDLTVEILPCAHSPCCLDMGFNGPDFLLQLI
jgi:hypothetical protein